MLTKTYQYNNPKNDILFIPLNFNPLIGPRRWKGGGRHFFTK